MEKVERKKLQVEKAKETFKLQLFLIGDGNVGKSCLASKYCYDEYESFYTPTIAVDYKNKLVDMKNATINLNFFDFSGHPEFIEVRNEFYRSAEVVFLMFDLTLKRSLDSLDGWLKEAMKYGLQRDAAVYLIGNKKDLNRAVSTDEANRWATSKSMKYFEISVLKNIGIDELFNEVFTNFLRAKGR